MKMQNVRIYEMPVCKMVSSDIGMFGEEKFEAFEKWFSAQKRGMFPKNFLFNVGDKFQWLYMYEEGMNVPEDFNIVDFSGGLYAVATGIDQETDWNQMTTEVDIFLDENGLERVESRSVLENIITSPLVETIMGYAQMNYYFPIKAKE